MTEYIKVKTRDFDEIEISEREILYFPEGMFAFEDSKRFVLLAPMGENKFPMWLQSVDSEDICFIIFDPFASCPDYSVTLSDSEKKLLGIKDDAADKIEYLVIGVVPGKYEDTTVNLKSPIAVNTETNTAVQIIAPEKYPIKFPLFKKEEK